jgi:hypothetical protein
LRWILSGRGYVKEYCLKDGLGAVGTGGLCKLVFAEGLTDEGLGDTGGWSSEKGDVALEFLVESVGGDTPAEGNVSGRYG